MDDGIEASAPHRGEHETGGPVRGTSPIDSVNDRGTEPSESLRADGRGRDPIEALGKGFPQQEPHPAINVNRKGSDLGGGGRGPEEAVSERWRNSPHADIEVCP
eukprot:7784087-Alexandrium_andersonii.AAC.1